MELEKALNFYKFYIKINLSFAKEEEVRVRVRIKKRSQRSMSNTYRSLYTTTRVAFLLLCLAFILSFSTSQAAVQQSTLPTDEFNSVAYLFYQYGIGAFTVPLNDQTCNFSLNSWQPVKCLTIDGQVHVTQINIDATYFTYQAPTGQLNPMMLSLPYLLTFRVNQIVTVTSPNVQIIDFFHTLYRIQSIEFYADPTITAIPNDYLPATSFPSLQSITFQGNKNLVSLGNFFNGTGAHIMMILNNPLLVIQLTQSNILLKNLNTLVLSFSKPSSLFVYESSFPNLKSLSLDAVNIPAPMPVVINSSVLSDFSITLAGANTSINPSDLGQYRSLTLFRATSIIQDLSGFTSISSSLVQYNVANNNLATFPYEIFSGTRTLAFDAYNNYQLSSPIPPQFCTNKIDIRNTSITSVPDCFWCYPSAMKSDLVAPPGFGCKPTLNTTGVLPSLGGFVTLIGSNLGWAEGNPNLSTLIPNSKILYRYLTIGSPEDVIIHLSPSVAIGASVIYADITWSTITHIITPNGGVILAYQSVVYNPYLSHSVSLISQDKGITNIKCTIISNVSCEVPIINGGSYELITSNQYRTVKTFIKIDTPISYPLVTSAQLTGLQLSINGEFGISQAVNNIVKLNNTMICTITSKNQTVIECTLSGSPTPGLASLQVIVDANPISLSNMVSVPFPPSIDLKQKCIQDTLNCYGHGQCNDLGICLCEQNYYDNCRYFKNPNVTFVQNDTKPVATFELDGYQFFFSLVAIQELDADDKIVQELITDKWNVTDLSGDDLTSLHYRLLINSTLYPTLSPVVNVTSLIEYSTQDRQLPFGDSMVSVGANSIKVGVNVTGWQYRSILSHLRVVFSTIVNNEQKTIQSCSSNDIPTFEEILGSDSYLRVIKNNTQFYGRFLSYSYSDGRKTFSRNELINQTSIIGKSNESLALIGVHIPQCASCLLDPDFSALVVGQDKESNQDCSSKSSNTWKIAVGVAVGGAVLIALIIGAVVYLKDNLVS
ncbi:hypothetical protein DFA_09689 [Cavenderia fasciculata]|uniref:ComC supersandwich domain-containing protein n=1 Tax=Cavenderia fasciculata TaxID=261658 RepID=F4Q8B7_CACFS|nr:uncharacterized protein DFA_09689 [Cavenderia fasciculata]EGG16017.1 hypothetical protein DFA_09689 [Cavenderia fasciculata]|eukprot:XP_004352342.1 hypothetical protein DFA_09689 [Cavenderia fasciculata]